MVEFAHCILAVDMRAVAVVYAGSLNLQAHAFPMSVNLSSTFEGVVKRFLITSRTSSHLSLRLFAALDDGCDI
ncbi:hypothetical protein PV325_000401, partial [Microctonus aethiopoides]